MNNQTPFLAMRIGVFKFKKDTSGMFKPAIMTNGQTLKKHDWR